MGAFNLCCDGGKKVWAVTPVQGGAGQLAGPGAGRAGAKPAAGAGSAEARGWAGGRQVVIPATPARTGWVLNASLCALLLCVRVYMYVS